MADAAISNPEEYADTHWDRSIRVAAVTGALAAFAALTALAMSRNGWSFDYPLDDVYIHLAMAEQIARGGYGVNPSEIASAASSPLYPLLLVPLSDTPIQRWLPLVWNIIALVAASVLFARALARAGFERAGVFLGAAAPLALSMVLTAFTGMENMAHGAASLAIVLGLWRYVETDRIGWLLIVGIVLGSAFRLEGLALGVAASAVVALLGRPWEGLGLMALAALPAALFAGFLVSQGLDPLPNSVIAKLGVAGGGPLAKFGFNIRTEGGQYLLALTVVVGLIGAITLQKNRRRGYFALVVAAAGFAHLLFGSIGWMDRYENYVVIALVAALALSLVDAGSVARTLAVTAALAGGLLTYGRHILPVYAWNLKAIAAQHGEMARFAKDFAKSPVAVNDIGYVSWRNPSYVLDLWGLASREALTLRKSNPGQGWAGALVEAKGVEVAMIYDQWLGDAVPPTWVHLGTLNLDVTNAFLGGPDVAFYAIHARDVPRLREALSAWVMDLPERATFKFVEIGG